VGDAGVVGKKEKIEILAIAYRKTGNVCTRVGNRIGHPFVLGLWKVVQHGSDTRDRSGRIGIVVRK
jgi:hypothetical protein